VCGKTCVPFDIAMIVVSMVSSSIIPDYAARKVKRRTNAMAKRNRDNIRKIVITIIVAILIVSMLAYYVITVLFSTGS
jgi:O-antigen/teichoic acid export membrane protein